MGAALLPVRFLGAGRSREAAVRPLLHQEQQSSFRSRDPRADGRGGFHGQRSALMRGDGSEAAMMTSADSDKQRKKLLIIENDRALRRELETMFADLEVTASDESDQVLALVRRVEPDVVVFDIGSPRDGTAVAIQSLDLLRQILNIAPDTKIIAVTEHDARELAVQAVGLGAADFYHKPIDASVLSIVVRRAFRIRELEEENWRLREQTGSMALEGIIGVSDAMRTLCRSIEKVAPTNATVLILGDSG